MAPLAAGASYEWIRYLRKPDCTIEVAEKDRYELLAALLYPEHHQFRTVLVVQGSTDAPVSRLLLVGDEPARHGGTTQTGRTRATASFTARHAANIPEEIRGAVAPLLESIDQLNEQIDYHDRMLEQIARQRYPKYVGEC